MHLGEREDSRDLPVLMCEEIGGALKPMPNRKHGGRRSLDNPQTAYLSPPGIRDDKKRDLISMVSHIANKTLAQMYYNSLTLSVNSLNSSILQSLRLCVVMPIQY